MLQYLMLLLLDKKLLVTFYRHDDTSTGSRSKHHTQAYVRLQPLPQNGGNNQQNRKVGHQ